LLDGVSSILDRSPTPISSPAFVADSTLRLTVGKPVRL
jgi:hypothetical protein